MSVIDRAYPGLGEVQERGGGPDTCLFASRRPARKAAAIDGDGRIRRLDQERVKFVLAGAGQLARQFEGDRPAESVTGKFDVPTLGVRGLAVAAARVSGGAASGHRQEDRGESTGQVGECRQLADE